MSHQGVLHIGQGAQSEFVPLQAWMRDRTNFTLISAQPFFRHYLIRRAFATWHKVKCLQDAASLEARSPLMFLAGKVSLSDDSLQTWLCEQAVRLHRFGKVRAIIQNRMLFCKPVFNATLKEVIYCLHCISLPRCYLPIHSILSSHLEPQLHVVMRPAPKLCAEQVYSQMHALSKVQMLSMPEDRLFTLEEFKELQSATREQKAKPGLQLISDAIRKVHKPPRMRSSMCCGGVGSLNDAIPSREHKGRCAVICTHSYYSPSRFLIDVPGSGCGKDEHGGAGEADTVPGERVRHSNLIQGDRR